MGEIKKEAFFSSDYKYCEYCGRLLAKSYKGDFCPDCLEKNLFGNVKEFIRSNDVNEYQVAEYFDIPIRRVKKWIREGRIEYKTTKVKKIEGLKCQKCGTPVNFGSLCMSCLKKQNRKGYGMNIQNGDKDAKMYYVDEKEQKNR
ncbi:hypothetical protein SAMN05216249_1216 [Acetitomaculum ruminis DSM 5522]|uniref:MerR family transcriptional regulator n=1 Tax=Acetitomaculum ruminis DSM 5522 TaxID=1120918 RepID=A0A1I1A3N9_9FIRM|nr:hypothetical protein [Acetitomaculum ruminis]SFB32551.1 hypothetical protein SAMN05216249_1216 [Acetitomaculum ruminis DSM 5522]